MAAFRTRITELFDIRHPILLGGMHHLGQSDIVAAVVNAGAMGFITAQSFDALKDFRADLRRCRALTDDKAFGVNLTLSRRPGANKHVPAAPTMPSSNASSKPVPRVPSLSSGR